MKTFIIAEIGVNHNGSAEMAFRMIEKAAKAGADAVKFQTFKAEDIVTRYAPKAEYQKANDDSVTQFEMLKKLELSPDDYKDILDKCKEEGVEFMSSPFSIKSAEFLASLGMKRWKIASGEITNLPLLRYIAKVADTVILSTGMSTLSEVEVAIEVLEHSGLKRDKIKLLHCTTSYPTPFDQVNLNAMQTLRSLNVAGVGYSDHTVGINVPMAAVSMGATVIEKHFTLDRSLPGPDHQASLEPEEFEKMVSGIREIELALGNGEKQPSAAELSNLTVARKSIVAAVPIKAGEILTELNLTVKRPGSGMSPMLWDNVLGQKANRDYQKDEQLEL